MNKKNPTLSLAVMHSKESVIQTNIPVKYFFLFMCSINNELKKEDNAKDIAKQGMEKLNAKDEVRKSDERPGANGATK